ncbi:Acetamidase regulatory protein [Termitomyces sp. T112]|nr:Acetamidase regulatory protein [Termitomyces sp. T112]
MTSPPGAPRATSQPLPQEPPPPPPKPPSAAPKKPRPKKAASPPPRPAFPPYAMNPYPYQPYPPQSPPQQYPYPMHYYPPYQYPQMMMYAPPRTPAAPASPPSLKRKRKADAPRDDDDDRRHVLDIKKRTKTQRACDSCRSRKIRCDILPDADPPICQHCKQYAFECTFFLPITETRFRKKKLEEDNQPDKDRTQPPPAPDTSVYGPTSAAHLLHSQASISSRIYETYDARNNYSLEVSKSGDGLITVRKPTLDDSAHSKPTALTIERETIEQLINAYFTDVAPLLPVVTKAEFLATPSPPPILLYSMCLVAAARRQVPQMVFDSIRFEVNSIIKSDDVLSTASIANVQALLILCMTGDCHSQFVPNALSALWLRLGTAIRMAQDLGLHRAESVKQNIELRRRLWGACLISDRWISLTYGHPSMIDVQDCDVRLPSSGDPNELYIDELVRLSVILGRVLKTIYSPSGLAFTTDEMLYSLLGDMEAWKAALPEHLKFRGPETPRNPGLLHLLYSCVCMMFWRVFMRISYTCPAHLKFGLTVEQWSKLVALTGESIDWLEANDHLYDVWLLVAYAATSCALVQYHTWARRKDDEAAAKLRKLKDTVRRWEGSISPDHMSARRKTAEIIALLYEATQGPHPAVMEAPPLNPTGGVTVKTPVSGLDYKKDPTRPGGGVFIATGQAAREGDFQGVPAGVVISPDSECEATPAVVSSTSINDRDRASLLSTSSSFAPPLPNDGQQNASPPTSSNVPPMHRGLSMSSALRSTAGGNPQGIGSGSPTLPSIVNFTPLSRRSGSYSNMNPAMNVQGLPQGNVQVMNVLDGPQGGNTLQEFAIADNEFLAGIPGSMFDWGQWDTFFSRFTGGNAASAVNGMGQTTQASFQGQRPSSS